MGEGHSWCLMVFSGALKAKLWRKTVEMCSVYKYRDPCLFLMYEI